MDVYRGFQVGLNLGGRFSSAGQLSFPVGVCCRFTKSPCIMVWTTKGQTATYDSTNSTIAKAYRRHEKLVAVAVAGSCRRITASFKLKKSFCKA